jgi:hypothetical protein
MIHEPFWKNDEFNESWNEWWNGAKRKSQKCSKTDRAQRRAMEKIEKFSNGDVNIAIKILDRSSDNGWTDLYALPEELQPKLFLMPEVAL